jgi:hypothetical protein
MIKVDLHMHSGEDPEDGLAYTAKDLVDRAVALGYGAIAVTLHGKVLEDNRLSDYARQRGLLLIRSAEWRIGGRDVVLHNVSQREAESIHNFDDLRALRRARGDDVLVVAPHPTYPRGHSLREWCEQNADVFDAIELAQIHLPWLDPFNKKAIALAGRLGKPVIASSDAHNLWMFGRHYTLVDAEPTLPAIFAAIRAGNVRPVSPPVTVWECLRMFVFDPLLERKPGRILRSFSDQPWK